MLDIYSVLSVWARALLEDGVGKLHVNVLFPELLHYSQATAELVDVEGCVASLSSCCRCQLAVFASVWGIERSSRAILHSDDTTGACLNEEAASSFMCSCMPG